MTRYTQYENLLGKEEAKCKTDNDSYTWMNGKSN